MGHLPADDIDPDGTRQFLLDNESVSTTAAGYDNVASLSRIYTPPNTNSMSISHRRPTVERIQN